MGWPDARGTLGGLFARPDRPAAVVRGSSRRVRAGGSETMKAVFVREHDGVEELLPKRTSTSVRSMPSPSLARGEPRGRRV